MKKVFLTSVIAVMVACPAWADAVSFPTDGIMKPGVEYANAATLEIMGVSEDGATAETEANYDDCPAGSYCTGGESQECPVGSYSAAGASECTPCQRGKTTSAAGATRCDTDCWNAANVATWDSGTCVIANCNTGYHLVDGSSCVANQITINWYSDEDGTDLITSTQVQYDGNIVTPTNAPLLTGKKFKGWSFKKNNN